MVTYSESEVILRGNESYITTDDDVGVELCSVLLSFYNTRVEIDNVLQQTCAKKSSSKNHI